MKSRVDGKLFALKAQAKATVIENGSKEKLVTEYMLMRELSHPFIVECFQAFQDKKYIFFLMGLLPGKNVPHTFDWIAPFCDTVDQLSSTIIQLTPTITCTFVIGGEVMDLLDEYEKFPESWTRFYCGTVVLVFEFMHQYVS